MSLGSIIFIVLVFWLSQVTYLLILPYNWYVVEVPSDEHSVSDYVNWMITSLGKEYVIIASIPVIGGIIIFLLGIVVFAYSLWLRIKHPELYKNK